MERIALAFIIAELAISAVLVFILINGMGWLRVHRREVTLGAVLAVALVAIILHSGLSLRRWTYAAFVFGLVAAGLLYLCFVGTRKVWWWYSSRHVEVPERHPVEERWFVYDGQQERGPFSTAEMLERFSNAQIAPTDCVWRPGMTEWKRAYEIGLEKRVGGSRPIPLKDARNKPDV